MPATKQLDIQERLHVPTEDELDECKRLYLTCENALKTLRREKTQTRRIIPEVSDTWDDVERIENRTDRIAWQAKKGDGVAEVLGVPIKYKPGETRLVTTPHWRTNDGGLDEHTGIWDEATRMYRGQGVGDIPDCKPVLKRDDWHQIHTSFLMPKWASRIAVEVQDVWVERVQEISQDDAVAEGVGEVSGYGWTAFDKRGYDDSPQLAFRYLWNDLHGEDAWERNDWVRCVQYELITE